MSTISSTTSSTNPYLVGYSSNDLMGTDTTAGKYTTSTNSSKTTSSSTGSYSQGLVSQMTGLDTNSLVNESMASDVIKLNNLLAKEQQSQWMQDRYRSIITNMQSFNSKYFDVLSSDYILGANSFSTNVATPSNGSVLGATALNSANAGTYTVTSATLATSANITTSIASKPAAADTLSSMGITSGTLTFNVNGKNLSYKVDPNATITATMQGLSSVTGYNFNYSELTGKFSISTQGTGASQNVDIQNVNDGGSGFFSKFGINVASGGAIGTSDTARAQGGTIIENTSKTPNTTASASDQIMNTSLNGVFAFTADTDTKNLSIGGKTLTVKANESISTLMSDLSTLTGTNFSFDSATGKVSVEKVGATSFDIHCDDSTTQGFFNGALGLGTTADVVQQTSSSSLGTIGKDGSFTIMEPGDTTGTTVNESSNNFTIDGVSYNISTNISSSNPVTINVSQNVSSVVDKIQDFVNSYNNLIDGINSVITEKRDYSYSPLSASQESQMTASQITAWNQKAQKGLLANDGVLSDMLSAMRTAFYTPVDGNNLTMASVGLSTSDDPANGGKLTLNVSKLTKALQSNPQQVVDLFNKTSTSYPSYTGTLGIDTSTDSQAVNKAMSQRNKEEGIFQRLSDITQKYSGTYVDKNGNQGILLMRAGMPGTLSETKNTLYKQIKQQADAVTNFKTRMTQDEKMYSKKYSTLQSILSQLSTQQSYLTSMLSSSSS